MAYRLPKPLLDLTLACGGRTRPTMDLTSLSPLTTASLLWQPRPSAWVLTVVCKATLLLRPGGAVLAPEQIPVFEADEPWGSGGSLRAVSDLVPMKPLVDVLLTGHAHAPGGQPVRSLVARLVVGGVDKAIEVSADRSFNPDGALVEGARFARMPLSYERAAGGPGTWNPVGVAPGSRVPNLAPPGTRVLAPGEHLEPVGFGPIAPAWPSRRERLGRRAGGWSASDARAPLPEGLEPVFFNAAPADQQLQALREDERLVLENLDPDHPRLVTALPGLRPRATIEGRGAPRPLAMRCDTLWIDVDRSLCTLTWRGQIPLESPEEPGRVVIAMDAPPAALEATTTPPAARAEPRAPPVASPLEETVGLVMRPHAGALPFAIPPPRPPSRPGAEAPPFAAPRPELVEPLPMVSRPLPDAPPPRFETRSAPPRLDVVAPAARVGVRELPRTSAAPRDGAVRLGWFDPEIVPRLRRHPSHRVVLAERALERLRAVAARAEREDDDDLPDEAEPEVAPEDEARRDVLDVMGGSEALDAAGVERALVEALAGEPFAPPLVLAAGELAFAFDELETLKATAAMAGPSALLDKRLKETLDMVAEVLKIPGLHSASGIADGLTRRIEEAFAPVAERQRLPADYLEGGRTRVLLAERRYQRRVVLGKTWIRSVLLPGRLTVYLPEALAPTLPLFPTVRVRVLGVVEGRQEPGDGSEACLCAAAFAAVIKR